MDKQVGDALLGASCGVSTLNPYGGIGSSGLYGRTRSYADGGKDEGAKETDASRCVRTDL